MSAFGDSKLILTYFDLYGRGEAIRMALVYTKTEFEDNRVSGQSWQDFKASGKCKNGQLPVLEVGGHYLNQSEAIIRFVGSQTGLYDTSDPFQMWAADSIINTWSDFSNRGPKNAEGRPLLYGMFSDTPLPEEALTKMVEHRGKLWDAMQTLLGEKTFFGGESPSIADFWMCADLHSMERNTKGKESQAHVYAALAKNLEENHSTIVAWGDRLGAELKDYIAARRPGTL